MKLSFRDYASVESWSADVAIIGGGAGGAAAAAALAEQGLQVVLLEAGSHWSPGQFKPDAAWAYRNLYQEYGGRVAVGNVVIPVPGGRGVGGSTLINSAICFRTPPPVMKDWSERYGCWRLAEPLLGPQLDRVWQTTGVTVNPVQFQKTNNLIFKQGAEALGLKGAFLARSAPRCVGCGVCQMGCPTGGKASVDRTFLEEALATGRVAVHADCRAAAFELEGGRVTAVSGALIDPTDLEPAGRFTLRARAFVLSGGPVGSPRLLLSQGLSDPELCGHNLHLHPASGMLARFEQEIRPWEGVTQGYYVDCWDEGFLCQVYSTSPDQTYLGMPYALGPDLVRLVADFKHMAMAGPLVHDEDSVGRVLPSALLYELGAGDRAKLLAGLRRCAEIFFAAGALEVYAGVVGGRVIRSPEEIPQVIHDGIPSRALYVYASHPMGTCRMGEDPAKSVVDPDGRVWGLDNLYVADASIFPTSLGVNPQVTTMAVGLTVGAAAAESLG